MIRLGALGDVILSFGALRDIRLANPDATILFLTAAPYAKLLGQNPDIDEVVIDPRAHRVRFWTLLELRRYLRTLKIDRVYDLQDCSRSQMYHRWLQPVQWVGSAPGCSHPVLEKTRCEPRALINFAGRMRDAGINPDHVYRPDARWMADLAQADAARSYALPSEYVLLIPGSSARHHEKRWPYFADLAQRLADAGHVCVTAPGPDEIDLCRAIPAKMLMHTDEHGGPRPLNYFELARLAMRARYVVGNDTGPSHLASRCGVPGLALFGGHTPASRTSLDTVWSVLEVSDLKTLSVDVVADKVLSDLQGVAVPTPKIGTTSLR